MCVRACLSACMSVCLPVCLYVCRLRYTPKSVPLHTHIYICICTFFVYIHIYKCMYILNLFLRMRIHERDMYVHAYIYMYYLQVAICKQARKHTCKHFNKQVKVRTHEQTTTSTRTFHNFEQCILSRPRVARLNKKLYHRCIVVRSLPQQQMNTASAHLLPG